MKDIDLIDKYLQNGLTNSERDAFEKRVESDKDFAEQVEIVKNLKNAVHNIEKEKLSSVLSGISAEHRSSENKFIIRRRAFISAAAVILLIISGTLIRHFYFVPKNIILSGREISDRPGIKTAALKLEESQENYNENEIYKNLNFRIFIVSVFAQRDSSNYGFLPKKTGEYELLYHITGSVENSYSYYNGRLILNTEMNYNEIELYEQIEKDQSSILFLGYGSKTYRIEKTKMKKRLIPVKPE